MFYGDLFDWFLPLSKACCSGVKASRLLFRLTTGSMVWTVASGQAHKNLLSILSHDFRS